MADFSLPGDHLIYLCVSKDHGLHFNDFFLILKKSPRDSCSVVFSFVVIPGS